VQEGPEDILLYPILGNLSNYERGLRVFRRTNTGKPMVKACSDLGLTFVKACSDLLASHYESVIVLDQHDNMEVF
jgi:hypothetical protein